MDCGLSFTTLNGVDIVTRCERRDKLVPTLFLLVSFLARTMKELNLAI